MTTVVLGWDGLDYELATEWGLADSFGEHYKRIETFDNEILDKPHTEELWPSIITGERPDVHGVYAAEEGSQDWENPIIDWSANVAESVVPQTVRTSIGAMLRARGAEQKYADPTYYSDRGISTVFDEYRSLPLAIPNYQTDTDDQFGILTDRDTHLKHVIEWGTEADGSQNEPGIPEDQFDALLVGECHKKLGIVREAIHRDYDLIFVWLSYLDSVGHVAPIVDESGYQARSYAQAATWTREIAESMSDGDTLITVSDHGLRDGYHTHDAFLASSDPRVTDATDSVLDLRAAIEAVTPKREFTGDDSVPVREQYQADATTSARSRDDVESQLEDLGYL